MPNQRPVIERRARERVPTGVSGLDVILHGGLFEGASCLIVGEPGTGKTTLGSQVAYSRVAGGEVAIFLTVVAESHDRMLGHLAGFDFFKPELVGSGVHYFSLIDTLADSGLRGALEAIRRTVREHGARLVVVDGAARFQDFAVSSVEYRHFVADLISQLAILGCTTLLLAQPDSEQETLQGIGTLVDGLILLEDRHVGIQMIRMLQVLKLRGSPAVRGHHEFAITDAGLDVYPRLESLPPPPSFDRPTRREWHAFGVKGLDAMLKGGLLTGSTTLLAGPLGIGKTTLGLHFLAEGAHQEEPGVFMTFEEDAGRLIVKADMLGMELSRHVEAGQLRVHWESTVHRPLDSWADELLDAVVALNAKRLVIDGLDHLTRIAVYGERFGPFLTSLCQRLRSNGVATVFIIETPSVDDGGFLGPLADTAASLDNVVLLRYVEPHARLHRLISILRMRESGFDATVREFSISDRGIEIEPTGVGATAALDELQGTAAPPGDEANLDE